MKSRKKRRKFFSIQQNFGRFFWSSDEGKKRDLERKTFSGRKRKSDLEYLSLSLSFSLFYSLSLNPRCSNAGIFSRSLSFSLSLPLSLLLGWLSFYLSLSLSFEYSFFLFWRGLIIFTILLNHTNQQIESRRRRNKQVKKQHQKQNQQNILDDRNHATTRWTTKLQKMRRIVNFKPKFLRTNLLVGIFVQAPLPFLRDSKNGLKWKTDNNK